MSYAKKFLWFLYLYTGCCVELPPNIYTLGGERKGGQGGMDEGGGFEGEEGIGG